MTICYLGLGSNLRCPQRQLNQAIKHLKKLPKSHIVRISKQYKTIPLGSEFQPFYTNQVVAIFTHCPPERLLTLCQSIEKNQGRVRKKKWGSRTLDIDILMYGKSRISKKNLIIPHSQMLKRSFVLVPLLEISPDVCWVDGKKLSSLLISGY